MIVALQHPAKSCYTEAMGILRAILARFAPAEPTAPETTADKVSQQKADIHSAVARLLSEENAELHSSVYGDCLHFSAKLREALLPEHPDLQLQSVFGHDAPVIHYHLRTPEGVVIDPTWRQWLSGGIPEELPPIFIGTREDLIALVRPFAQKLPKRYSVLGRGPSLSPEEFVDLYYGFGPHAHTAKDVTFQLSNAHKDARSRASKGAK